MHMWSKHRDDVGYLKGSEWADLMHGLTVEGDWEDRTAEGRDPRREVPPPRSLGGTEPGAMHQPMNQPRMAQQPVMQQPLLGQPVRQAGPPSPKSQPNSRLERQLQQQQQQVGGAPRAARETPPPPPPPGRGPPQRPEAAQPPLMLREAQDAPVGAHAVCLQPARGESSAASDDDSRSPSPPRRERSRPSPRRRRRAATAPIASQRDAADRRGGQAGRHPPSEAGSLETDIRMLRHARAANLPLLLPPFLRSLSTQQLRSTVVLVMDEWHRREAQ